MADWDAPLQPIGQPSTFPGTIPPPPLPSGQSAAPTGQSVGTPIGRDVIVGFWKGKGVPDYVAEGIADATHDESGIRGNPNLFNPAAVNPESGAIGLHQDLGERKDKLQAQPDWQDPKVQLEHAYGEVTGGDADASKHWNEIKNAKTREEAAALFKHYFERPGAAGGDKLAASWDAEPLKVSAPGWNVSPDAIAADQAGGADVRYMSPADYLAMTPPIAAGAGQSAKARSLAKSLAAGDDIESIPSLDVKPQAGKLVVYDQDGRNRALAAQEAGVDLIPVAINGVPKTGAPEQIQGMTGTVRPFDWKPVPVPHFEAAEPVNPAAEAPINRALFGAGIERSIGGGAQLLSHVLPEPIAQGINDFNNWLVDRGVPLARVPQGGVDQMVGEANDRANALQNIPHAYGVMGVGEAVPFLPVAAAPGAPGLGASMLRGALTGAGIGAAQPVDTSGNGYWPQEAAHVAGGAVTGAALPVIGTGVSRLGAAIAAPVLRWLGKGPAELSREERAIVSRIAQSTAAGGPTAQDILDLAAATPDKPLTLADLGGKRLQSLLGRVARRPGPAQEQAAAALEGRSGLVRHARVTADIGQGLGDASDLGAIRTLASSRSAAAQPIFEEAFQPGSVAPLEQQFAEAFRLASSGLAGSEKDLRTVHNRLDAALGKKATQSGNVYGASASFREEREARSAVEAAEAKIADQRKSLGLIRDALREAQAARAAGVRGGVWSPRLHRLMANSEFRPGIATGMRIQRNEADARGTPFNPIDYAITGTDQAGNPIVSKVPNMRLLHAAKRGLDNIVEGYRDLTTGRLVLDQLGRSQNELLNALKDELRRLNPTYGKALDAWAGPSQSMDAVEWGRRVLNMRSQEIAERMARMSINDKEFARLGFAATLRKQIDRTDASAGSIRRMLTAYYRDRLAPMFPEPADFARFTKSMEAETHMAKTEQAVLRNSLTAERLAEDQSPLDTEMLRAGAATAAHAAHGNVLGAAMHAARFANRVMPRGNPQLDLAISRLLTEPLQPGSAGISLLRRFAEIAPQTRNYLSGGAAQLGRLAVPFAVNQTFGP